MELISNNKRKILVPPLKPQLCPQLAHLVSCGWWKGVDKVVDPPHLSTNHNSPHRLVVGKIVILGVAPEFLIITLDILGGRTIVQYRQILVATRNNSVSVSPNKGT